MPIAYSILIVTAGFICFAFIVYFLFRLTFHRIENDDWEERYLQMKKDAKPFASWHKPGYN